MGSEAMAASTPIGDSVRKREDAAAGIIAIEPFEGVVLSATKKRSNIDVVRKYNVRRAVGAKGISGHVSQCISGMDAK